MWQFIRFPSYIKSFTFGTLFLKKVKTKYLKSNQVSAKLSGNRDPEVRIIKKQLKLICLLRIAFLKAEGNFLERKELKY